MTKETAEWIEVFTGPRFAGIPKFIKNACWVRGLNLDMNVDKGWIRETVRIKVTGDKAKVHDLKHGVYYALRVYNEI